MPTSTGNQRSFSFLEKEKVRRCSSRLRTATAALLLEHKASVDIQNGMGGNAAALRGSERPHGHGGAAAGAQGVGRYPEQLVWDTAALRGFRRPQGRGKLPEAPMDSSAPSSSTSSPDLPSAPTSASSIATQAAATTLTAFARAALARAGDISDRPAALPRCPRALASNYKHLVSGYDAQLPSLPRVLPNSHSACPPGGLPAPPRALPPVATDRTLRLTLLSLGKPLVLD